MRKITVNITPEQKDFLALIEHEDAATNQSTAIQWCIDACMKIEERYKIDACYVAYNNIVLDTLKDNGAQGNSLYNVKFYDSKKLLQVSSRNFTTAGIVAMAYKLLNDGVGFEIEWIESDKTHNKVPFEI